MSGDSPERPNPAAATPATIDSLVATGRGDDGTTGLLYGGPRIAKDDPRTEAYGTIDEAVAALGLARAELGLKAHLGVLNDPLAELAAIVLRLQRELFVVGAELATTPEAWSRLEDGRTRVSAGMVDELTILLEDLERRIEMPREFVVPGETRTSAALELARTILRRAERRAVTLRTRRAAPRRAFATVSEPPRGPGLGPGPGRRAGGGTPKHPGPDRRPTPDPAFEQRTGPEPRRTVMSQSQNPYAPPSTLGVRPVAALSAGFLSQAFGWMFAGLLLTAGVAWVIQGSPTLTDMAAQWFLPVIIGQFVAGHRDQRRDHAGSARPRPSACSSSTRRRWA